MNRGFFIVCTYFLCDSPGSQANIFQTAYFNWRCQEYHLWPYAHKKSVLLWIWDEDVPILRQTRGNVCSGSYEECANWAMSYVIEKDNSYQSSKTANQYEDDCKHPKMQWWTIRGSVKENCGRDGNVEIHFQVMMWMCYGYVPKNTAAPSHSTAHLTKWNNNNNKPPHFSHWHCSSLKYSSRQIGIPAIWLSHG